MNGHPLTNVIDQLRTIRERSGFTQDDLEYRAGLPHKRVSHWESGRLHPSLASLIIWADALGCRLHLTGSPVPNPSQANGEYALLSFLQSRHIEIHAST